MDRRTALALALALIVFAVFTSLQARYAPKRPVLPRPDSTHAAAPAVPGAQPGAIAPAPAPGEPAPGGLTAAPVLLVPERRSVIETPLYRAEFSNRGARLVDFQLKRFAAAHGPSNFSEHPAKLPRRGEDVPVADRVRLTGEPTFGLDLGSGASLRSLATTTFAVSESIDAAGAVRALTYVTQDSSGLYVRQTWRVRPDSYMMDLEVETRGVPSAWRLTDYSLTTRSWALATEADPQNDLRGLRAVSLVGKDLHRDGASGLVGKNPKRHEGAAHWAGVQSHYFLAIVGTPAGEGRAATGAAFNRKLDRELLDRLPPNTKALEPAAEGSLVMPLPARGAGVQHLVAYFGPADYFALARESGPLELGRAVDMGFTWLVPVSKLLLWLLRAVNGVVQNFGVTILILATLVRVVLHPLNMTSMKSMRSMQRLKPEMDRIKDKFKDDPQAQNAATMALYKENGVNPAGGCLPMVLQMPLFFAMYAVIFNVIDLRQAPFVGWIHDLSTPDVLFMIHGLPVIGSFPIRLLPLLMAGSGFLSQRFTPTDPQQAPTMYMMNIVMLGIFYPMPSGLVLYWTVMNVLTAIQQWLAMRGDDGVVVVAEVPRKGNRR
jgi:YidC/Oxa1 family membrane protein insertase